LHRNTHRFLAIVNAASALGVAQRQAEEAGIKVRPLMRKRT
jgi:hypothetical protein